MKTLIVEAAHLQSRLQSSGFPNYPIGLTLIPLGIWQSLPEARHEPFAH